MKKIFTKLMLLAVAATALASCAIDDTNDVATLPGVEVSINATTTDVSRSEFGELNGTTYPTFWSGTEKWAVCLNDKKIEVEDIEFSDDKTSAHASVTFEEPAAYNGTYTLFAVSPFSAYVSHSMENDYIRYRIPASQTPSTTSCDAAAQVLIAQSEPAETVSGFDVVFKHAVAYVKFSFLNVAEGGNVTSVSISSEDVALAGRYVYAPSTKTISFKDEAVYEINLTTNTTSDLWVAFGPAAVQGKTLTFTINTDKGKLSRPVEMPGNFEVGCVKGFNIDMTGIEYPVVENVVEWHQVTSLADITEGEYVIVDKTKVLPNAAVSNGPSNSILLSSKATVGDGVLTNVDDSVIWNFIGDNTAMKVQSYADNTLYLHNTSANDGVQVNTTSNKTWAFEVWKTGFGMKCNSRYLGSYENGSDWRSYTTVDASNYGTDGACLTLYKKFSTEPMISASNIEVSAEGGDGEATYSVKNMTDDVTGESNTDWLTAVVGGGEILWEAEPNYTGAVRSGEIVLTSAGAGVSKTITVSQAADVFEVSATEISLGADADATAKFTVNSTYAFTLTNPAADKLSLSATSGEGTVEITVTALTANALTEALSLGNIVVTRTGDNATKSVAVEQKAASTGGDEPESVVVLSEQFDNNSASDSSNAITTSTFPNFSGATDKAYKGKYGSLKLGTSSKAGYITSKSLDLSSAFTVQIDACKYGSDTGNIVVTCGTQTQTINNSELGAAGSFKTFTLTFSAATATSTIKIATSSKRAYIDNVVITRN